MLKSRLPAGNGMLPAVILILVCSPIVAGRGGMAAAPHVVFVTGDEEYRSEESMPMLGQILHRQYGMHVTICYAVDPDTGFINPDYREGIAGLEALEEADLAVFFIRFRQLPEEQLQKILSYVNSGRPIAGLRTSTHAFRYPEGDPRSRWNDAFGTSVFGQKWITHHGHYGTRPLTAVSLLPQAAGHPVLRGVEPFQAYSWLYHVEGGEDRLQGDCFPLLHGRSLKSNHVHEQERFPLSNPVAWTRSYGGARVFFTTLGHPYDFRVPAMRKLVVNGLLWALGREEDIPPGGARVDLTYEYDPSDAAFGGYRRDQKPKQVEP